MTNFQYPAALTSASTNTTNTYDPDWHVLVLFADDTERDVKGIWGPYRSIDVAQGALDELRNWPLDGFWDVRRLNKFIALKSNNDNTVRWTWQTHA